MPMPLAMPHASSKPSLHGIDRDALHRVVDPVVRAHGAEVVDVEFKPDRGGWVLRIYVERAGSAANRLSTRDAAVDLELCANVSRDLSPALDVVNLIPHAYQLEVGSPGIERPLRTEADFVRFAGEKAKLKLREPVHGQRVLVGTLDGVVGGNVRVVEGRAGAIEVAMSNVEGARLVFELAASPKGPAIKKRSGSAEHRSKH
jgi:ribosome maturation factor RimP